MDGMQRARELIAAEREKKTGFLDLGNLRLTELPVELFKLTHLRSLNLGPWYLDERGVYHQCANGGEAAGHVHASWNCISSVAGIDALADLMALTLMGTAINDLTPLQGLTTLRSLDCSHTAVRDLTPLQGLSALQSLDCSYTQVSDFTSLQGLSALQSLSCWGVSASDLTPLQGLTALQALHCSDTQVSDLTPLQDLIALQSLSCSGTQVSDLTRLRGLTALHSLNCSRTHVSDLTPLQDLTALQSVDCSGTQVSDLTPLQDLAALQSLSCSGTQVSDLTRLRGLTALHSLDCSGTQLSDLTPLRGLTALQSLYCSDTQVSDLTRLRGLTALQSLDCSGTQVSDLTPLRGLTVLKSLNCSATQVSDLTPLRGLADLQFLGCSGTQVTDLAPLLSLVSLEHLMANHCSLKDLPRQLLQMETLTVLRLHETTIPGVPAEVLSGDELTSCLEQLRAHLKDLDIGTEEVREAKLVVVGNGRVGKTQICRRLRGLPYDESIPSTHGISVTSERWSGSTKDEALNIWDFGGQDIYHGAHTLFMKTSAVFLIVWHPDFEAAGEQAVDGLVFRNYPLPYWLEYVRTLGRKDCPVVVVQTRCDRPEHEVRKLPVDDAFLNFPSLKPCWYSAKTGRGRGALEDALRDAIESLRERDGIATVGAGRMRVLRQLEVWRKEDEPRPTAERQHRTLSQSEFRGLCEQKSGVSSPESLLEYLHNLGVVFYQANLFHDRIILDQSWALEAVYGVFDRRKAYPLILSQGGRFTRSLLAMTAWREYSESEQRLFLSLMESCGIAFVHREEDKRLGLETEYLAPDLLPARDAVAAHLTGRWNDAEQSWRLEYEYPFLHPGLMRALLCDVGRRSHEAGVYWKYGLWVYEKDTGCRALIEQQMTDERRGRITLRLQGRRHEELGRWLRERIAERNRLFGYPNLEPVVDELGRGESTREHDALRRLPQKQRMASLPSEAVAEVHGAVGPERTSHEPTFDKPPTSFFAPREPQVFVSYAWGDETPEGRQREKVVDDLCAVLGERGVKVLRDRNEMRPGDLISEFMDRLAKGDYVLAVISDKYLRSEYCMYELFRIYRNCADKPERFLKRVIPLILPDAGIDSPASRLKRAIHWTTQEEELEPLIRDHVGAVGTEFFRKFKLIGEFARNTSNMLEHLVDKLQPRDFERQAREGFREILDQMGHNPKAVGAMGRRKRRDSARS